MTTSTTTTSTRPATRARGKATVATLVIGAALGAVLNLAISRLAVFLGVSATYPPLSPQVVLGASVVGALVAIAGWQLVRLRAASPARVLGVLVPLALVVSLTPDVVLLVTSAIPGTTAGAVAALMSMHVALAGVMTTALHRALPARS